MALTRPAALIDVWRRIWGIGAPEVALVMEAPDVGFAQRTVTLFNFPIGISGAGGAGTQLTQLEEGVYDLTFAVSYVSGGVGDQQMAFRAQIRDLNNNANWQQLIPITSGQNVVVKKRCAVRQGNMPAIFNEQAWTLAGTFAVTAVTADPVLF